MSAVPPPPAESGHPSTHVALPVPAGISSRDPFRFAGSVGRFGENRRDDLIKAQILLGNAGYYGRSGIDFQQPSFQTVGNDMRGKQMAPGPIPKPDPAWDFGRPWFRRRRISFIVDDWQAFDEAVSIACPYARYVRGLTNDEERASAPPPVTITSTICEQVDGRGILSREISMLFDPEWRLEYTPPDTAPPWSRGVPRSTWSVINPVPWPSLRIYMPCPYYPAAESKPEHIHYGSQIDFTIEPGNEQHVAFMRQFWSLFGKLASNRHQVRVSFPEYRAYDPKLTTDLWLGRQAIRWALEDPRRLLDYAAFGYLGEDAAKGSGTRPIEEKWRPKLG